jgi:hypothetical protein
MTVSTTTQQSFAEVDDDGGANAGTLGTTNANWTQLTDTVFRIRFLVDTTGKAETDGYHLYQNYNGTGYQRVTTSSTEVQSVASGFGTPPADGTATTQRIGSGTFTAGEWAIGIRYDEKSRRAAVAKPVWKRELATMHNCPYCMSFWYGLVATVLWFATPAEYREVWFVLAMPFALGAVVSVIQKKIG